MLKKQLTKQLSGLKDKFKKFIILKVVPIAAIALVLMGLVAVLAGAVAGDGLGGEGSDSGDSSSYVPGSGKPSGSSLTNWDEFLSYVETKEGGTKTSDGKYYIVEDDDAGNPTVGHGLCLHSSSDGYLHVTEFSAYGIDSKKLADDWLAGGREGKVSVNICDEMWSNLLESKYNTISSKYPSLKEYQKYALTDVMYRRGNISGFDSEYSSKWTSADEQYGNYVEANEPFSTDTLFNFFWNGGHAEKGVNTRKQDQWVLFKYGYYRPLGKYCSTAESSGDSSSFLATAQGVWQQVCDRFTTYGAANIVPKGTTIDCSAYVSWVLYEYGYTGFEGVQTCTVDFYNTNWNEKYGWTEIPVGATENVIDKVQPGDLLVRYNGTVHHITIIVKVESGTVYVYDCGQASNWTGKNGEPTTYTSFITAATEKTQAPGKIIRVTKP